MYDVQAIYNLYDVYVVFSAPIYRWLPLLQDIQISFIFNISSKGLISISKCIQDQNIRYTLTTTPAGLQLRQFKIFSIIYDTFLIDHSHIPLKQYSIGKRHDSEQNCVCFLIQHKFKLMNIKTRRVREYQIRQLKHLGKKTNTRINTRFFEENFTNR